MEEKPELTADGVPNKVTVTTKDGKVYSKEVKYPRGHAKNKMTDNEVVGKFMGNVDGILSKKNAERLIDTIMNLEKLDNVNKIPKLWVI